MWYLLRALITAALLASPLPAVGRQTVQAEDSALLMARLAERIHDEAALTKLFEVGDSQIDALIGALSDPTDQVRYMAERVIRYLGNARGLDELSRRKRAAGVDSISGPITPPLTEWDYERLNEMLTTAEVTQTFQYLNPDWVYALVVEGSPRALRMLARLRAAAALRSPDETERVPAARRDVLKALARVDAGAVTRSIPAAGDLERSVRTHLFIFDDVADAKTVVRLLGYNGAGDKALLIVGIGHYSYRLVLKRTGPDWQFYSLDHWSAA